jgi:hypothetical protein
MTNLFVLCDVTLVVQKPTSLGFPNSDKISSNTSLCMYQKHLDVDFVTTRDDTDVHLLHTRFLLKNKL